MSGKQEKTLPHRTLHATLRHFRSISLCSGLCIIKGSYYLYRNNRPLMPVPFDAALPLFLQRTDRFYFLFFLSSISAPAISCISHVSIESEYMFFISEHIHYIPIRKIAVPPFRHNREIVICEYQLLFLFKNSTKAILKRQFICSSGKSQPQKTFPLQNA